MTRARTTLVPRFLASFAALVGALALLVADSPGPQCADYAAVDVTYDFENTCTPETTTGQVHFVITAEQGESGDQQQTLAEQAAAGGLYLDQAYVVYSHAGCDTDGETGTAQAIGFNFNVLAGPPPTDDVSPMPETFSCYYSGGQTLDAVQSFTCTNLDSTAEKQSCTLTLTPPA